MHDLLENESLRYLVFQYEVGSAGFEPTTSGTQNPNHTKLDHDPDVIAQKCPQFNLLMHVMILNNKPN